MTLSVVIVTCDRTESFRRTCMSVQTALPADAEVIVFFNGADERSLEFLMKLEDRRFRWVSVPRQPRCVARNRAMAMARNEIIHVLDDDVVVPRHLFARVMERFRSNSRLGVLGGPNLTPPNSGWQARLFGAAMCGWWAAPGVRYRYSDRLRRFVATERSLILCNLAIRRVVFEKSGGFFPDLKSNEENLLLFQLARAGTRMEYDSSLYVFHERRDSLGAFLNQIRSYALGRGQQTFIAPKSFVPLFGIPTLSLMLGLGLLATRVDYLVALFILHQTIGLVSAFTTAEIRKVRGGVAIIPLLTFFIHVVYGLGFLEGWMERAVVRLIRVRVAMLKTRTGWVRHRRLEARSPT